MISTIKGAGNSSSLRSYAYEDHMPLQGVNYYRLRQVDFDGKTNHSEIKPVTTLLRIAASPLYPNPVAGGQVKAQLNIPFTGVITARFLDITGKIVQQTEHDVVEGLNELGISTDALPKGCYYVTFSGNDFESDVLKLIK